MPAFERTAGGVGFMVYWFKILHHSENGYAGNIYMVKIFTKCIKCIFPEYFVYRGWSV